MGKKLSELKAGEKGLVISNKAVGAVRRRLMDMGLIKGVSFSVVRKAPLGDPIEISLNGFLLTLRCEEAENILVQLN